MLGLLRTVMFTSALRQGVGSAKRRVKQAAMRAIFAVCAFILFMVGLGFLIAAAHDALVIATDGRTAKLICGGVLVVAGIIVLLAGRPRSRKRVKALEDQARDAAGLPVAGLLGPEAERFLSRNAGNVAIGAFVAGMLLALRRR